MSKRKDDSQLDLDLIANPSSVVFSEHDAVPRVVPFVDAASLQIRRDAVRRVAANGIFAVHNLRLK